MGRVDALHWAREVRAGPRGGREGAFVWAVFLFVCCFGRPEGRPELGYL